MKKFLLILISTVSVTAFCMTGSYPSPDFIFRKIQVTEGLSENSVYCILQDSKGYMWFGTKDGLSRYDGFDFCVFRHNPKDSNSLGNNFIRSVREDCNNYRLYIGSDAGLYIFYPEEKKFLKKDNVTKDGLRISAAVNSIFQDSNGNVWIGTMTQGIFRYNPGNDEMEHVALSRYELGGNAVWSIFADRSGVIWAGTRLGLLRYNPETGMLDPEPDFYSSRTENTEHEILSVFEDNSGNMWLGTWDKGLKRYDRKNGRFTTYLANRPQFVSHIRTMFQYSEKSFFVGSDDGLYLFDTETETAERIDVPLIMRSLSDQNVYAISSDREGGIWIGTYFGGVNYLSPDQLDVENYFPERMKGTLSGKAISQFCEDELGNIWIATEDGGVNCLDTKTRYISQPVKTSYHNTHALLISGDELWVGTFSRGVDVYNMKTGKLTNYRSNSQDVSTVNDDCIFSLYKTGNGDIYAGTPAGLNLYDRQTGSFKRIEEANGFIYDIREDETGNLWLAAYGQGVKKFDVRKNKWISYDSLTVGNDPVVGSKLTGVHIDGQKNIIFTSEGRGIFIYDRENDNFININETDGLPNNVTYGVIDDTEGNWWISSNKGLVMMNPSNPGQFTLYNRDDGLQGNQFNFKSAFRTKNGKFYFGGVSGFSAFYPENLRMNQNKTVPPVYISKVKLLSGNDTDEEKVMNDLLQKKKIILPWNKSSFTVSCVSLSYVSPLKNRFAYKLDGDDAQWNYAGGNRNATYMNLRPGKYVFMVKASNNSDLWNEEGARIEIEVLPPWWTSFPLRLIYLTLIVGLVYYLISFYHKKSREKQKQQLNAFKKEQETQAFKSKIDFFNTVAHEIRTPLSLIVAPLEEIMNEKPNPDETSRNLSVIEKNVARLTKLMNQLLDFRNMDSSLYSVHPEQINLNELLQALFERFEKTAQKNGIDFRFVYDPDDPDLSVFQDREALTKIISNLLTNAIKYTKDTVAVSITADAENNITVRVQDNGKGIPDANKQQVFEPFYRIRRDDGKTGIGLGLSLVRNLAGATGATVHIEDGETGGSIFVLKFPDMDKNREHAVCNDASVPAANSMTNDTNTGKPAILLVDDNADMLSYISQSLDREFSVNTAHSAEEAVLLLENNRCDVIISDVMMEGIDGISFTRKLKNDINFSHIPIILLSAKTEREVKIEGLMSGAEVFLEKPFSIACLKAQIMTLLENRKSMIEAFNRSPFASLPATVSSKKDELFLQKLNEEIDRRLAEEDFNVEMLAGVFHMSRSNLQRKLKSISGETPGDYMRKYRLRKSCRLLVETEMRINEVAFAVGFGSASHFTRVFRLEFGILPKDFAEKHKNSGGTQVNN